MGQKHSRHVVIVVIGMILVFALTGCSSGKVKFEESEFSGTELYPEPFAAHSISTPQFTLRIHDQLYDPETSQVLYETVLADTTVLSELLALDRPLEITLVPETPSGDVLTAGNALICTPDDVLEGDYQKALVQAATGFDELWKLAGVYGLAFGEAVDEAELVAYYSEEENRNTLSLFPTYFLSAYTDRLTLNSAQDTAASFTNFILTTAGAEAFAQPIGQDAYRQDWLDSLGVTIPWQPLYDLSFLEDAQFSSSEDYELIITTDNRVYSFSDNFVDTPEPIMQLLAYLHNGMDKLINTLQTDAPEHYPEIAAVWEAPIYYYFDGNLIGSYREPAKHSIYLSGPTTLYLFDETIYYLYPKAEGEMQIWKNIGLADYLFTLADVPEPSYYSFFQVSPDELTGDDAAYLTGIGNYYLAHADYPADLEDFDFGLLYEAMAMTSLTNPSLNINYPRIASRAIGEWTNQENAYLAYPGNSLSYPEAYLFTKYLVETYGLDAMLTYYASGATSAFKSTFGLSYTEAFADFRVAYGIGE
jgi:hypothetical protein